MSAPLIGRPCQADLQASAVVKEPAGLLSWVALTYRDVLMSRAHGCAGATFWLLFFPHERKVTRPKGETCASN